MAGDGKARGPVNRRDFFASIVALVSAPRAAKAVSVRLPTPKFPPTVDIHRTGVGVYEVRLRTEKTLFCQSPGWNATIEIT
jgi:hypothetical protein